MCYMPLQFRFRKKKHSTAHALTSLTEKVKQTADDGKFDFDIFIDLKKGLILLITVFCLKN